MDRCGLGPSFEIRLMQPKGGVAPDSGLQATNSQSTHHAFFFFSPYLDAVEGESGAIEALYLSGQCTLP